MEILFVSHKYPPATGGMEKQSYELINHMSNLVKVHRIVYEGGESRILFFLKLSCRIRKVLKEHQEISIIHFNDGLMGAFGMQLNLGNVKRTVTLHGLDAVFPGFIYQRFIFPMFNGFDKIFAVSRATASACIDRGISDEKIVVVNNGVDVTAHSPRKRQDIDELLSAKYKVSISGKKVLVALGRPVKRKGFSWLITNVMPLVHPDFMLLLIGPVQTNTPYFLKMLPDRLRERAELFLGAPSDEFALQKLLTKTDKALNVVRLGKLPQDEVDAVLSIAEAFVMPNIEVNGDMEGFGLVCLEASVRGTKVIASASGGITDAVINGKNGSLLPPGHIASWVFAINQLMESSDNGPDRDAIIAFTADNYSWNKMAEEYFAYFSAIN